MPKLTKYQTDALLVLRVRLNARNPLNTADEDIKAHLRAIEPWLATWVRPALDAFDGPNDYEGRHTREQISLDAWSMRKLPTDPGFFSDASRDTDLDGPWFTEE